MSDSPNLTNAELQRRDFLRLAGLGAGAIVTGIATPELAAQGATSPRRGAAARSSSLIVVGAGVWGTSTALELAKRGAKVTLIDQYGPGNSRSTSGDETRGIRSSYGDRAGDTGLLWTRWAREAISSGCLATAGNGYSAICKPLGRGCAGQAGRNRPGDRRRH